MADKIATTRISDLPENITMQIQGPGQPSFAMPQQQLPQQSQQNYAQQPMCTRQPLDLNEQNLTYTQMNVHPNPYGNPQQPQMMPIPQGQPSNQQHNPFLPQQDHLQQNAPQYRLPSRDIPSNTDSYMQDPEIQPNYIPAPKLTSDYIRDYEDNDEIQLKNHKQKKHKERLMDVLFTELQIPILIGILFFIFQMPMVNTLILKRFSFLSIYNADGNFNFNGLFLKSAAFGLTYYAVTKMMDYVSSI